MQNKKCDMFADCPHIGKCAPDYVFCEIRQGYIVDQALINHDKREEPQLANPHLLAGSPAPEYKK